MLTQLKHLHKHNVVFKYLNPQHIIVTEGFMTSAQEVTVRISDIAIM